MRKILLIAFLAAFCAASCEPLECETQLECLQQEEEDNLISVCIKARENHTKSSLQLSETVVSSLNVYAYRGGQLAAESFGEDDELSLELIRNVSYTLYALANCGQIHAPLRESDLQTITVTPSGMVMCNRSGVAITAGSSSSLEMPLTRLFARYSLVLDKNLENCEYQITSVRVKQQASSIKPFAAASAASSTADGDYASAADLAALNAGGAAVFYVPENCQGVLLPDNDDPWAKIPANIPASKRGLCTYLHIEGDWTTIGATADLGLNLMLGADNCTDFNVLRNSSVTITLSLTDSGTLRSSWKVDMENFEDERVLSFPNASQTVMQEDGWTKIPLTVSPPDMAYSASFSDSGSPIMEAKVEGGEVWVRGLYDGDQRPCRTLTVRSWDGLHSSSTDVTLDFHYSPLTDLNYSFPTYAGEYGYYDLYTASASNPIVVQAADWTTTVGPARSENVEYHIDNHNGVEYYVLHSEHKLFFRPLRSGAQVFFQFTQFKSWAGIMMPAAEYPILTVTDGVVTESGRLSHLISSNYYYDSVVYVYLTDSRGEDLDVRRFRIPSQLLEYKHKQELERDYYSEFLDFYGLPDIQSSERFGKDIFYWTRSYDEFEYNPQLALIYCYGTDVYGDSTQPFPMNVSLHLSNGDTISSSGAVTAVAAFPSQRYLGLCYNFQIAPGSMRSMTSQIDFTSGGSYRAPGMDGVTWTVNHADGSDYNIPSMAVDGGTSDRYSAGASLSGNTFTFSQMSQTNFPACGMLGLTGTVTNPHTGRTFTGYYTVGVVLYVPVGCHFDRSFGNRVSVTHAPFTEFTVPENRGVWVSCFPSGVKLRSEYGDAVDYDMWGTAEGLSYEILLPRLDPDATLEEATAFLSGYPSALRFSFKVGSQTYQELLLDQSSNVFFADDSWSSDGSKGYYHLVRQYDLGTFDHGTQYNGLDNYLIEAAYESMDIY
jgi:hypothetical protein